MCEFASSFVLRGTFIDEVMPKTHSMQRSSSEPAMAGHSSESSVDSLAFEHTYGVRLQAKYVATPWMFKMLRPVIQSGNWMVSW